MMGRIASCVQVAASGTALALTNGQKNACLKHAESNGRSYAKGIERGKVDVPKGW